VGFLRSELGHFGELWEEPRREGAEAKRSFGKDCAALPSGRGGVFANYAQGSQRDVDVRSGVSGRNAGFLRERPRGISGIMGTSGQGEGEEAMREFRELWKSRRRGRSRIDEGVSERIA